MKIQVALIFALLAVSAFAKKSHKYRAEFEEFVETYGREYANEAEYQARFHNFQRHMEQLKEMKYDGKTASYGVTKFFDYSKEEMANMKMPAITPEQAVQSCLANNVTEARELYREPKDVPTAFDWRNKKPPVVTPVKNQGQCGSCWTFSTAGNIESQWALAGNVLTNLSEQMIVDCSHACVMEEGQEVCNQGCGGGWMWTAMTDVIAWGGLETEEAYPYTAETGTCEFNNESHTGTKLYGAITNYTCIGTDENQILLNLLSRGPLSIAMNADLLETYTSGIIDPSYWWDDDDGCDPSSLDHALLLVGYGVQEGDVENTPFWTIKNSWGEDWGEEGYFRIIRGYGACGMNEAVTCSGFGNSPMFHVNE